LILRIKNYFCGRKQLMSYRYFIRLSYNGAAYGGWQSQPNAPTVQQKMEDGLAAVLGLKSGITGCGRTDAGVHASVFFAHFDWDAALNPEQRIALRFRLNRFLPDDISVHSVFPVLPGAHARFSAGSRSYEYTVIREKDPFRFDKSFFIHGPLDVESMNRAALNLLGRHDFSSFSKTHTQVNHFFCDIRQAEWTEVGHILTFSVQADRFLRNMVRAVVGTLIDVGKGKLSEDDFIGIIAARNRSSAGYSVPARGLMLTGVGYPGELFVHEPVWFSPENPADIISPFYDQTPRRDSESGDEG
jgi:tRNA pseudouridine38-40 synthase